MEFSDGVPWGALITGTGMVVVNVVGWVIASHRDGKSRSEWFGKIGEQVKGADDKASRAQAGLDDLPCREPNYFRQQGDIAARVESYGQRLDQAERALIDLGK